MELAYPIFMVFGEACVNARFMLQIVTFSTPELQTHQLIQKHFQVDGLL
jgi:hypothetical protein